MLYLGENYEFICQGKRSKTNSVEQNTIQFSGLLPPCVQFSLGLEKPAGDSMTDHYTFRLDELATCKPWSGPMCGIVKVCGNLLLWKWWEPCVFSSKRRDDLNGLSLFILVWMHSASKIDCNVFLGGKSRGAETKTGNDDDLLRVFPVSGELWPSYIKDYLRPWLSSRFLSAIN